MVKSKKIRCLATESPSARASSAASKSSPSCEKTRTVGKIEKSKCNICGAAFTHLDDLAWHRDTIHDASSATSVIRKSSRIEARASSKTKGARRVETIEIDLGDEKTEENAVLVADGGETAENSEDTACKKSTIVESVFHCHHCEHICKNKSAMNKHLRIHHPDESINGEKTIRQAILSCAICLRTFAHKANLRKHVITHNPLHNGPGVKVNRADQRWKKGYCCDICDRAFNNQRDILAHRDIVHSTAAPLEWMRFYECCCVVSYCDACGHYFKKKAFLNHDCRSDPEEVAERVQQLLESNPSFECDICSLCFHWKWMYRSHRESVHPNVSPIDWETLAKANVSIYCPSCLKAFADKDTLSKHRSTCIVNFENEVKRFDCSLCDRSFCRKFDFHRHLKSKHPDPELTVGVENSASRTKPNIPCPFCDIAMPTRNVVLKHIKIAHGIETDTPFVCVLCNKVFKRKATMETHNQIYHPKEENTEETEKILEEAKILLDGETAYHCNICNRNVLNSTRFVAHYRLHKMERKFTCDLCGKQTRTQHQLNTHVKIIHLDIRNFECDICNKSFHSKQSCEEHRRIHTGERPYSCEICGKTFIAMNALFTHKKFHNDFFAHSCSLCPKKFKVRRSLINHIRTHTGERPYKCDLCPKTFNNSSRFSYHKKVTHSDNRPFTCDQCGSCFKANKFLMRHMKLHTTRTHIQFRRRNNPAYFEKHATNAKKPVACLSKKSPLDTNANTKASNGGESGATETVTTTPVLYTVRTFRKIASKGVELENVLISSAATSDELTLADDTEPHFLADPLASDG